MHRKNEILIVLKKIIIGLSRIFPKALIISLLGKIDLVEHARVIGVNIGLNCAIYKPVSFGSEPYLITIGDHVSVGIGVMFITHDGGVWVLREKSKYINADRFGAITVGNNVFIGARAIFMPGITIGNNVIIGAGAVVSKNIPDNSVAVGVPARVIKTISDYEREAVGEIMNTASMDFEGKKRLLLKWKEQTTK